MLERYNEQINKIMEATEKELSGKKDASIAGVTMAKLMVGAISRYVEKEAETNTDFADALSLTHKNAGRLLKYVWRKARELSVDAKAFGVGGAACMIPDDVVYDWVNEYYLIVDDKEDYEKELAEAKAKKEKEEKEKAKEKELKDKAREKAIAKLSKEEGFSELPEEEKEAKIKEAIPKILSALRSAETKKKAKKKAEEKKDDRPDLKPTVEEALAKADGVLDKMADGSEHKADPDVKPADAELEAEVPEAGTEAEEVIAEEEPAVFSPSEGDGEAEAAPITEEDMKQISLFDLFEV